MVGRRRLVTVYSALVLVGIVVITLIQLSRVIHVYGSLFFIETFLPDPPLPLQERPIPGLCKTYKTSTSQELQGVPLNRLLCLVLTSPQYHETRAVHLLATWGRHCGKVIFLTSKAPKTAKVYNEEWVPLPEAEGYYHLWEKVAIGFERAYEMLDDFDWILKADDDSFVIVENLLDALRIYDFNHPLAGGLQLRTWDTESVYLNGGASYVLSAAGVRNLVELGLRSKKCQIELNLGTAEDVNMANCLKFLGVTLLDLRDSLGRQRFHVYSPHQEVDPRNAFHWGHLWLKKIPVHPYNFGFSELTDHPISFHYVSGEMMYLLYYLIYVVHPTCPGGSQSLHNDPRKHIDNISSVT